ncbi:MAG: hypothetical protein IIC03_01025 [Proteobacteria bacterium]|nr:hypothetical protein [Pseudomonadota bacterium]
MRAFEVTGVAGVAPLQQYLLATGAGRLQAFDIVWDVEGERWYHLYPDQDLPPGDGLHWTGPYKNWNARCAECHATGFVKNYDAGARGYDSRQAETGVGCEACHGPGSAHVAWAKAPQGYDPAAWPGSTAKGFTIGFGAGSPETEIEQCAGCHSRREPFGDGNPLPGTAFHDAYRLALLRADLYHPDGTIKDEVYVYGSFLQSRMSANGVRCSDCHDPHTAGLKAEGSAVCAQCHSPAGNQRFPTLRLADYDDPSHHFHPKDSAGAQCVGCHMIERTYMGIDGRRDHSFRIPRPDLFLATGAPNACTDCHAERNAAWAAAQIAQRFSDSDRRGPHFSRTFAAARHDPAASAENLLGIAERDGLPGMIRASALDLLRPVADAAIAARAAPLIGDDDKKLGSMIMIEDISTEKRMKSTMSRYMDPGIADQLMGDGGGEEFLGGKSSEITVLFSDIRSFTTITEALGAQGTVKMLNEYFTIMVDIITREGGMLDKFIGDAIMAGFGIPVSHDDDEDRAVRAAIAMIVELWEWNVEREARGEDPIDHGVGLNTGMVVSGNIGSPKRMDYTMIGDGVNLAARLESACKQYSARVLISEFTKAKLKGTYKMRDIDMVVVKGKTEPVGVYEVLDYHTDETYPNLMDNVNYFNEGVKEYRAGNWDKGIGRFQEAIKANETDKLAQTYIERCEHLKANPPDDWDGIWIMTGK